MTKPTPIPRCGVPLKLRPRLYMPIDLYWDIRHKFNWDKIGQLATKTQVEEGIEDSRGQTLPNDILPALDPGDVLVLQDGIFWIDRDWILQPIHRAPKIV